MFDTKAIPGGVEDKDTCPRCSGKVFHAEKMMSKSHCYHKPCFLCLECQKPLDSVSCCDSPEGEIFCKLCYAKNFGPHGYGFGGSGSVPALVAAGPGQFEEPRSLIDFHPATTPAEEKTEGADGCKRCGYRVFEAERLMAAGRSWHRRCFSCCLCSRHLDSTLVNDGPDGEIYCKSCYVSKFGMAGYGFGQGAGTLLSVGWDWSGSVGTELGSCYFRTATARALSGLLLRAPSSFPEETIVFSFDWNFSFSLTLA